MIYPHTDHTHDFRRHDARQEPGAHDQERTTTTSSSYLDHEPPHDATYPKI
jgi:hypothetical protein